MALTTIEQFATEMKMPSGALLEQLAAAGVAGKKQGDKLSEQDKTRPLDDLLLEDAGPEAKKKITHTRTLTTEITAAGASVRSGMSAYVEPKKRIFVKRDGAEA